MFFSLQTVTDLIKISIRKSTLEIIWQLQRQRYLLKRAITRQLEADEMIFKAPCCFSISSCFHILVSWHDDVFLLVMIKIYFKLWHLRCVRFTFQVVWLVLQWSVVSSVVFSNMDTSTVFSSEMKYLCLTEKEEIISSFIPEYFLKHKLTFN